MAPTRILPMIVARLPLDWRSHCATKISSCCCWNTTPRSPQESCNAPPSAILQAELQFTLSENSSLPVALFRLKQTSHTASAARRVAGFATGCATKIGSLPARLPCEDPLATPQRCVTDGVPRTSIRRTYQNVYSESRGSVNATKGQRFRGRLLQVRPA